MMIGTHIVHRCLEYVVHVTAQLQMKTLTYVSRRKLDNQLETPALLKKVSEDTSTKSYRAYEDVYYFAIRADDKVQFINKRIEGAVDSVGFYDLTKEPTYNLEEYLERRRHDY